jgi:hypothetical protein
MMEKPVIVFGIETWAMAEMDMKRLGTWGEGNTNKGTQNCGRARNMENKN